MSSKCQGENSLARAFDLFKSGRLRQVLLYSKGHVSSENVTLKHANNQLRDLFCICVGNIAKATYKGHLIQFKIIKNTSNIPTEVILFNTKVPKD